MGDVRILIRNEQSSFKLSCDVEKMFEECCRVVLQLEHFEKDAEVSVLLTTDVEIRKLNLKYRNIDKPTDVLSFLTDSGGDYFVDETGRVILGDVAISLERVSFQAKEFGNSFERELSFLFVHSVLHLLGYTHEDDEVEAAKMRKMEKQVLNEINYSNYCFGG